MENSVRKNDRAVRIWLRLMELGGKMGCHQREDRSFSFRGYQFPLCARCTGVTAGQILGIVLLIMGVRLSWPVIAVLIGVMGIDWGIQRVGLLESTNLRRFMTGTMCGTGAMFLYFYAAAALISLL